MHRALLVSEILQEIFAHVPHYSSCGEEHGSLSLTSIAALASTCKTFHEPAMDLLWADMYNYGIQPLLGCVARLYSMIYPHDAKEFCSEGVEALSEKEARQFLRHAARVRSLRVTDNRHFHLLTVFPIGACVFPRPLALDWHLDTNTKLHLFLSPILRRCVLSTAHSDLRSTGIYYHELESLSITSITKHAADVLSLSETIRSCKRLKHLQCSPLDSAGWEHLSSLHTLVSVTISAGLYKVPLDRDDFKFSPSNITTLNFHGETAAYIIAVLQHSEFPSLKVFVMNVSALPWADAEQLFQSLSQCKACQTLEVMEVISQEASNVREDPPDPLMATGQLRCFTQLRTLHIFLECPIYLDNRLFLEAMSSWPHIRSLELRNTDYDPIVTFRGLSAALRLCPHLHNLRMYLDTDNLDIDPETETFQHIALRTLLVHSVSVTSPRDLAPIIFSMLPGVCQVTPHYHVGVHCTYCDWDTTNWYLDLVRSAAIA